MHYCYKNEQTNLNVSWVLKFKYLSIFNVGAALPKKKKKKNVCRSAINMIEFFRNECVWRYQPGEVILRQLKFVPF